MKKALCGACSMMLACSMYFNGSSVAYGEGVGVGSYSKDVKAVYVKTEDSDPVYSVDISWDNMEFDYKAAGQMWNPETHEYDGESTEGTWDYKGNNDISVTNHSNAPINVTLSGEADSEKFDSAGGVFKFFDTAETPSEITSSSTIRAAKEGDALDSSELKLDAVLNIVGNMESENSATPEKIGTLTINVAATVE